MRSKLLAIGNFLTPPPPFHCKNCSFTIRGRYSNHEWDFTSGRKYVVHVILTCPPLGWYLMLSVDPILDLTFFRSGSGWLISRSCLGVAGDFGGVRMMATFFSLGTKMADLGVPGV